MPVPAAIVQEVIDVAVILNALRALTPAYGHAGRHMTEAAGRELHRNHVSLIGDLDRLRSIVDTLDDATPQTGAALIAEANMVVQEQACASCHGPEAKGTGTIVAIVGGSQFGVVRSLADNRIACDGKWPSYLTF